MLLRRPAQLPGHQILTNVPCHTPLVAGGPKGNFEEGAEAIFKRPEKGLVRGQAYGAESNEQETILASRHVFVHV